MTCSATLRHNAGEAWAGVDRKTPLPRSGLSAGGRDSARSARRSGAMSAFGRGKRRRGCSPERSARSRPRSPQALPCARRARRVKRDPVAVAGSAGGFGDGDLTPLIAVFNAAAARRDGALSLDSVRRTEVRPPCRRGDSDRRRPSPRERSRSARDPALPPRRRPIPPLPAVVADAERARSGDGAACRTSRSAKPARRGRLARRARGDRGLLRRARLRAGMGRRRRLDPGRDAPRSPSSSAPGTTASALPAFSLPRAIGPGLVPDALAEAETAIASAVVIYAEQATGSRVPPARVSPLVFAAPSLADPGAALAETAAAADPARRLADFNPPQKGYRDLRRSMEAADRGRRRARQAPRPTRLPIRNRTPRIRPGEAAGRGAHPYRLRRRRARVRLARAPAGGDPRQHGDVALGAARHGRAADRGQHPGLLGRGHGGRRGRPPGARHRRQAGNADADLLQCDALRDHQSVLAGARFDHQERTDAEARLARAAAATR